MPVPIRPVNDFTGYKEEKASDSPYLIDPDMLAGALSQPGAKLGSSIIATASDDEASVLFDLWQKCDIIEDGDRPEKKRYAVPAGVSEDTVLRLKAANLLAGDNKTVRFTSRAVAVIATMSLAEDNVFEKGAVKKPYSQILAESRMPKRHSRLALASSNNTSLVKIGSTTVLAQRRVPNVPTPGGRIPTDNTDFIASQRMVYRDNNSSKHYIVRIYRYDDGTYGVIGWNGRIGSRLTPQGKYFGNDQARAREAYDSVIHEKTSTRRSEPYSLAPETSGVPGRAAVAAPSGTAAPRGQATPQRQTDPTPVKPKANPIGKKDPKAPPEPVYNLNIDKVLMDTDAEEMSFDDDDVFV